ncbi:MAG: rod shape-determining protein MreD [Neisseria sp.]|nr:rod shape-determining protein MreD [Neisseria sp.]
MNDLENYYNRSPKNLIFISFFASLLLDFIPLDNGFFFWLPEFSALILLYWSLNRHHTVGIGSAFILGLLIDIGTATPLGLHAFSYTLMTFTVQSYQRQILLHSYGIQSAIICIALCGNWLLLTAARLLAEHRFGGFGGLLSPVVGALLWPLLNKIMLALLHSHHQRR